MQKNKGRMTLDKIPYLVFRYTKEGAGGEEALEAGVVRPGMSFLEAGISPGLRLIFVDPNKIQVFDKISIK